MGSQVSPGVAVPATWFPRSRVVALCTLCALIFLAVGFAFGFGAGWSGHENLTTPRGGGSTTPAPVALEVMARAGRNMTSEEDYVDAFN
jgi:ABC-type phosphate transport system substrate-binding protein